MSEAILHAEHRGISDKEREFILNELIRYLRHDSSGVSTFTHMGAGWKDVCTAAHQGIYLSKSSAQVLDAIASWHQLVRFLSIRMSLAVGRKITVYLTRAHANDPQKRVQDAISDLAKTNRLSAEFVIPDAASRLKLVADLNRRTFTASMELDAPKDRHKASAHATWILHQLDKCDDDEIIISAQWPGRAPDTFATLGDLRSDRRSILHSSPSLLPTGFEIARVKDAAGKFRGRNTFVEKIEPFLPSFYADVGQHLKVWVPTPPKMIKAIPETKAVPESTQNIEIGLPEGPATVSETDIHHADIALSPAEPFTPPTGERNED